MVVKFENICVQTGHDGIRSAQDILVSDLLDEYWQEPEKRLAATDFDQTLTRDDIGVLVFKESLAQPDFWKFSDKVFKNLLSPIDPAPGNRLSYRELVSKTAMKNIKTPQEVMRNAQRLHALFSSLEETYSALQKASANTTLREKFSREMVEFDAVVLLLEPFFSDFFGNQIFSRTRFLAGKSHLDVQDLSQNVLEQGRVQINDSIFRLFEEIKKRGGEGRIVTTNLVSIVRKIVEDSVLNTVFDEDDVIATKLVKNGTQDDHPLEKNIELSQYIEGEPVFGKRKVELLKQESVIIDRRFSLAAGDSVVNDGPMLAESLKNKGVSIIIVPENADIEQIAQKFEAKIKNVLKKASLSEEEKQRMWYLQSNQFTDARYLPHAD